MHARSHIYIYIYIYVLPPSLFFYSHTSRRMNCVVSFQRSRQSTVLPAWHHMEERELPRGPWTTCPSPQLSMGRVSSEVGQKDRQAEQLQNSWNSLATVMELFLQLYCVHLSP